MSTPTDTETLQELINDIRLEMRDYEELNKLINGQENSDRVIARAIRSVLTHFNGMPPLIKATYAWDTFPNRGLLITGVVGRLQRQVADLDNRNFFPASDGQVGIPSRQKGQFVFQAASQKWQEFVQEARLLRVSLNYTEALGGIGIASEAGGNNVLNEFIS